MPKAQDALHECQLATTEFLNNAFAPMRKLLINDAHIFSTDSSPIVRVHTTMDVLYTAAFWFMRDYVVERNVWADNNVTFGVAWEKWLGPIVDTVNKDHRTGLVYSLSDQRRPFWRVTAAVHSLVDQATQNELT